MKKKPIIGIVLDFAEDNQKYSYASYPWYALRKCYSDIVTESGGIALMIPYSDDIDAIIDIVDGLIIPGCDEDVNPKFYGEEITSDKVKTKDIRASFELKLIKKALEVDMPVFGICNGLQILNVALGGSLIQHIPDVSSSDINHEQPHPKNKPAHSISIEDGTILRQLSSSKEVMINTTHHQSIARVGKGLLISAKAPDGIIEAAESVNHKFVVGVQWHSEYLNSDLDYNLFKRLIEVSSK